MKYDNKLMNDVYLVFENDLELSNYLRTKTLPSSKFKACDKEGEQEFGIENGGIRSESVFTKTIITIAFINVHKNDILYDVKAQTKWIVTGVGIEDDDNEKKYRLRPHRLTTIQLRR